MRAPFPFISVTFDVSRAATLCIIHEADLSDRGGRFRWDGRFDFDRHDFSDVTHKMPDEPSDPVESTDHLSPRQMLGARARAGIRGRKSRAKNKESSGQRGDRSKGEGGGRMSFLSFFLLFFFKFFLSSP